MTEREIVIAWLKGLTDEILEEQWIEKKADDLLTNLRLAEERQ